MTEVGRWSDVAIEAPDDELDAIGEGIEFPEVEVLRGSMFHSLLDKTAQ